MVAVAGQSSRELQTAVSRVSMMLRDPGMIGNSTLFDGIIRRFAGDHDVMHMALAQSRAADTHEACFLQ